MSEIAFYNLDTDATPDISANDIVMAKSIADELHGHYPGQLWAITCDGRTGLITIRNLFLAGDRGYVLNMANNYSASDLMQRVKMAGGEILERFRMKRGRFDEAHYHTLPTNFAGRLEYDK